MAFFITKMLDKIFKTDDNELRCFSNYRRLCQIEIKTFGSSDKEFIELDLDDVILLIEELNKIKRELKLYE